MWQGEETVQFHAILLLKPYISKILNAVVCCNGDWMALKHMQVWDTILSLFWSWFCRDNICHIVNAPADVSWNIRKLATNVAEKAVSSLEGAGVFAVELFLTRENQVGLIFITS